MEAGGAKKTQITAALVGGRRLREKCLARFLELSGFSIRICAVENLREGLLAEEEAIDLTVIDTGDHSCSEPGIKKILACLGNVLSGVPVVAISDREDWSAVLEAMNLGVRAYFPSSLDPEILLEVLWFVQRGGTFIPVEALVNAPVHSNPTQRAEPRRIGMHALTQSERRVLELLRTGQSNKVIARELNIGESTVKVHVRRIMRKLNTANRTQAALVAQQMAKESTV
jgi:DNA-binding NarL/FixJ family response regulator